VRGLIPQLLHDQHILLARDPGAVAPPQRQFQQCEIALLPGHPFVQRRDAQIRDRQRHGQVLEQHQPQHRGCEQGQVGRQSRCTSRCCTLVMYGRLTSSGCQPGSQHGQRTASDQRRQAHQQHHRVPAGVPVAFEEGELLDDPEGQGNARVVACHAQARPQGEQEEDHCGAHPQPGCAAAPAPPRARDRQPQRHVAHVDVLPLVDREMAARTRLASLLRPTPRNVAEHGVQLRGDRVPGQVCRENVREASARGEEIALRGEVWQHGGQHGRDADRKQCGHHGEAPQERPEPAPQTPQEGESREDQEERRIGQFGIGLQDQKESGQCGVPGSSARPRCAEDVERRKRRPLGAGDIALSETGIKQLGGCKGVERPAQKGSYIG